MAEGSRDVESVGSTDWQPSTLPALRIDQAVGSDQLSIRIMTHKRATDLTSKLYHVLEEEGLDVLYSHMSSTTDKVLRSMHVKVLTPSTLDKDSLERKLNSWASIAAE